MVLVTNGAVLSLTSKISVAARAQSPVSKAHRVHK